MFHASDPDETSTELLDKTLSSLRNIKEDKVLKKTPWTDDPEMGETEKETFRGRVVVEIWDNEAKIAITGKDQISNLAKRVANRLDKHLLSS